MMISWFGILAIVGMGVMLVAGLCGRRCKTASSPSKGGGSGVALGVAGLVAIGVLVTFSTAFVGMKRQALTSQAELAARQDQEYHTKLAAMQASSTVVSIADSKKAASTEEAEQLRGVAGLLTSVIAKVEQSKIPLGSLGEPLQKFKEACEKITDDETETQIVSTATAPTGSPAWISEAQPRNTHLVESEPHATKEAADRDAYAKAADIVMADYRETMSGVGPYWKPDLAALDGNPVELTHTTEIPWDFAAGSDFETDVVLPDKAFKTYLRVRADKSVRGMVYRQWKENAQHQRLETAGMLFGGLVAGALVLAMFFGSDNRMQKRWRTTRFVLAAGALAGVVAIVGESNDTQLEEFLDGTNHVGPAAYGAEPKVRRTHSDTSATTQRASIDRRNLPTSTLFGMPLNGSRVSVVVLGDESLTKHNRNRLRDGLVECVEGFGRVSMQVVCSNRNSPRTAYVRSRNSRVSGNHLRSIEHLLDTSFFDGAEAGASEAALRAGLSSRPDTVVVIRSSDELVECDKQGSLNRLKRLHPNVVVHGIDFSIDSNCDDDSLRRFVSSHNGQYVQVESP